MYFIKLYKTFYLQIFISEICSHQKNIDELNIRADTLKDKDIYSDENKNMISTNLEKLNCEWKKFVIITFQKVFLVFLKFFY